MAHQGTEQFHANRTRQNCLVNAGFTVLRFTWPDLTDRPAQVSAQIRSALAPVTVPRPVSE